MKKKLLFLTSSILLCCTLVSCNLKDAITGENNDDSSTAVNKNDTNENDNKSVVVNDANTKNNDSKDDTITSDNNNNVISSNDDKNGTNLLDNESTTTSTTSDTSNTTDTSNSNIVNRNCRIFYFNTSDLKTYYVDTTVTVTDNAFTTALTNKLYTSPDSSDNFIVIPEEFGVKSATIDEDSGILKVIFNEDFTSVIPLGTSSESGLISAIVNTYGYNYGLDKVAIYFGDTLYTGLKGELPEGYYTVNTTDSIKLN